MFEEKVAGGEESGREVEGTRTQRAQARGGGGGVVVVVWERIGL